MQLYRRQERRLLILLCNNICSFSFFFFDLVSVPYLFVYLFLPRLLHDSAFLVPFYVPILNGWCIFKVLLVLLLVETSGVVKEKLSMASVATCA